jgi:CDP-diacylglycerol--serine O-phosphatidyltransferase
MIIVCAAQLQFNDILYWAIAALLFDFLDGTAARILNVSSEIGKELDSLADVVSFGVAPTIVLFYYWQSVFTDGIAFCAPFAIALFAAFRLAKFNSTEQNNDYFRGLPTPALALGCFVLPQVGGSFLWANSAINNIYFVMVFSLLGGFMLVSNFKFFSLKLGSKNKKLNVIRATYLTTCILLIVWLHFFGAFLCLLAYIGFSLSFQNRIN